MEGRFVAAAASVVPQSAMRLLWPFHPADVARSIPELAAVSGLPPVEAAEMLARLVQWRILEQIGDGYRRGDLLRLNFAEFAGVGGVVAGLAGVLNDRVRLSVLHPGGVSFVEHDPDTGTVVALTGAGSVPAADSASGQVLAAFTAGGVAAGIRAGTPPTVVPVDAGFARAVAVARLSGVGLVRYADGRGTAAVPVTGVGGVAIAALEVAVNDLDAGLETVVPTLVATAADLAFGVRARRPVE
jgi:DNA-binding IclR family transcriptional regulator